jgi:hypothetical protein
VSHDGNGPQIVLHDGDDSWDIARPKTAWFRRLGKPGIADNIPERFRAFALGEAEQALESVLTLVSPQVWINDYWSCRRASVKAYQYGQAAEAGLRTAPTLITSDPEDARSWCGHHAPAVAKSLHSPLLASDSTTRSFAFTNRVPDLSHSSWDDVATAPVQFQEEVPKSFEARVTTVNSAHFAVRIESAPTSTDDIDWRKVGYDCRYSEVVLPREVARSLDRLYRRLGLRYGAADFVIDAAGEWVYLETNPHGAWLWLEQELATEVVSRRLAAALIPELSP